jgi:hypothetical protein
VQVGAAQLGQRVQERHDGERLGIVHEQCVGSGPPTLSRTPDVGGCSIDLLDRPTR